MTIPRFHVDSAEYERMDAPVDEWVADANPHLASMTDDQIYIATLYRSPDAKRAVYVERFEKTVDLELELPWDATVYVIEGRYTTVMESGETFVMSAGDLCHYPAGGRARFHCEAGVRYVVVQTRD